MGTERSKGVPIRNRWSSNKDTDVDRTSSWQLSSSPPFKNTSSLLGRFRPVKDATSPSSLIEFPVRGNISPKTSKSLTPSKPKFSRRSASQGTSEDFPDEFKQNWGNIQDEGTAAAKLAANDGAEQTSLTQLKNDALADPEIERSIITLLNPPMGRIRFKPPELMNEDQYSAALRAGAGLAGKRWTSDNKNRVDQYGSAFQAATAPVTNWKVGNTSEVSPDTGVDNSRSPSTGTIDDDDDILMADDEEEMDTHASDSDSSGTRALVSLDQGQSSRENKEPRKAGGIPPDLAFATEKIRKLKEKAEREYPKEFALASARYPALDDSVESSDQKTPPYEEYSGEQELFMKKYRQMRSLRIQEENRQKTVAEARYREEDKLAEIEKLRGERDVEFRIAAERLLRFEKELGDYSDKNLTPQQKEQLQKVKEFEDEVEMKRQRVLNLRTQEKEIKKGLKILRNEHDMSWHQIRKLRLEEEVNLKKAELLSRERKRMRKKEVDLVEREIDNEIAKLSASTATAASRVTRRRYIPSSGTPSPDIPSREDDITDYWQHHLLDNKTDPWKSKAELEMAAARLAQQMKAKETIDTSELPPTSQKSPVDGIDPEAHYHHVSRQTEYTNTSVPKERHKGKQKQDPDRDAFPHPRSDRCFSCQERNSKCDGNTPLCGECSLHMTLCLYEHSTEDISQEQKEQTQMTEDDLAEEAAKEWEAKATERRRVTQDKLEEAAKAWEAQAREHGRITQNKLEEQVNGEREQNDDWVNALSEEDQKQFRAIKSKEQYFSFYGGLFSKMKAEAMQRDSQNNSPISPRPTIGTPVIQDLSKDGTTVNILSKEPLLPESQASVSTPALITTETEGPSSLISMQQETTISQETPATHETESYYGYKENASVPGLATNNESLAKYAMQEHVDIADFMKVESMLASETPSRRPSYNNAETESIAVVKPTESESEGVASISIAGATESEIVAASSTALVAHENEDPPASISFDALGRVLNEDLEEHFQAEKALEREEEEEEEEKEEEEEEPMDESLATFYKERASQSLVNGLFQEADEAITRLERRAHMTPGVDGFGASLYRKTINGLLCKNNLDLAEQIIDRFMVLYSSPKAAKGIKKASSSTPSLSPTKDGQVIVPWTTSPAFVKYAKKLSRLKLLHALTAKPKDLAMADEHVRKLLNLLEKMNTGSGWKTSDLVEHTHLLAVRGCLKYLNNLPQYAVEELADATSDSKGLVRGRLKIKSWDYLARSYFEATQINNAAKFCQRVVTVYRSADPNSKSSMEALKLMIKIKEAKGDNLEADGYRSMLRPDDNTDEFLIDGTAKNSAAMAARTKAVLQKLVLGPEWVKTKQVLATYRFPTSLLENYHKLDDLSQMLIVAKRFKGGIQTSLQLLDSAQGVVADSIRLNLNDLLRAMLEISKYNSTLSATDSRHPLIDFTFMDTWRPPKSKKSFVGRFRPKTLKVSPLSLATDKDNLAAIRILLSHGANVNMKSARGKTALHLAVQHGRVDVIKILLDAGADVSITSERGKSALDLARHADVKELLRPRMYLLGKENMGTKSVFDFVADCL